MKCINCGTENNRKERKSGYEDSKCKQCGHKFTFEPTDYSNNANKLTDQFFANAIAQISVNNSLYFTPGQFKYFLDRKLTFGNITLNRSIQPKINYKDIINIPNVNSTLSQIIAIFIYAVLNIIVELLLFIFSSQLTLVSQFKNSSNLGIFILTFLIVNCISLPFDRASFYILEQKRYNLLIGNKSNILAKELIILTVITIIIRIFYATIRNNLSFYFALFFFLISLALKQFLIELSVYLADLKERNRGEVRRITEISNQENYYVKMYFYQWIQQWQKINGSIAKLLPSPQENTTATLSSDVTAYSFDKLVVCDRACIAQFLIANNFHFEKNCAILSIDGYPQSIFDTIMQMLRRNPDLIVYALHDCSPEGVSIVHQLRTSNRWFRESNVKIIDVGILPRQVLTGNHKNIWVKMSEESKQQAARLSSEIQQNLTKDELNWLMDGKFVELECIKPHQLIQILSHSMANQSFSFGDDSLIIANISYYAVESFG